MVIDNIIIVITIPEQENDIGNEMRKWVASCRNEKFTGAHLLASETDGKWNEANNL